MHARASLSGASDGSEDGGAEHGDGEKLTVIWKMSDGLVFAT